MGIPWPKVHISIMQYSSVASMNLIAFPGPNCLAATLSHREKLILYTIVPFIVLALLFIPGPIIYVYDYITRRSADWLSIRREKVAHKKPDPLIYDPYNLFS